MRVILYGILTKAANGSKRLFGLLSAPTLAVLGGAGLLTTGLHMVYEPLAFIVPGLVLVVGGLWLAGVSFPVKREGR